VSTDPTQDLAAIEEQGYVCIPELLDRATLDEVRAGLAPHLREELLGRNDFEGHRTERVYSLVARGPVFERLAEHPRILAILDALLEPSYLLSASQAINILPGETAQAVHADDLFYRIARPRKAVSVATIWAIDDFTKENGSTQIIPGSHRWSDADVESFLYSIDFETRDPEQRIPRPDRAPEDLRKQLQDAVMPAGSVIVFLGTLIHRGGANRSQKSRLALSNQYCEPWARPQENYFLSVPAEKTRAMSPRVQELLGYSIHPPFMGHANGVHPKTFLESDTYRV
jgi:ectoine hydroxylase-related dioxygenase (phytanoyl-CoA dioxygenase family)